MEAKGHSFKLVARDKECTLELLDHYGFKYVKRKGYSSRYLKALGAFTISLSILSVARAFKPDIVVGGVGNVYIPFTGRMLGVPSLIFDDTEHNSSALAIIRIFSSVICTPNSYTKELGKKHVRYNGFHELAYLSPKYFTPDKSILRRAGIPSDENFILVRFVSWDAIHDKGHSGVKDKIGLVMALSRIARVVISSEGSLPPELEPFRVNVKPYELHDLLAFSRLFVGEGATMASEAAVLGVPSVYINTLKLGYLEELEKMGLVISGVSDEEVVLIAKKIVRRKKFSGKNAVLFKGMADVPLVMEEVVGNAAKKK